MAYCPKQANKSYANLLRENGKIAALKSLMIISLWALFNRYIVGVRDQSVTVYVIGFFFFCAFETWRPKFIRFLRGVFRGPEYRDKSDPE